MAVRVAITATRSLRRLFCTDSTSPSPSPSTFAFIPPPDVKPRTNLFVTGLSKRTTTKRLWEAFSQFGKVVHARVMTDRLSGISNGFGYVKYTTKEEAAKGIEGMDGKFLDGWIIFAQYAQQRQPPARAVNSQTRPHLRYSSSTHQKGRKKPINSSTHQKGRNKPINSSTRQKGQNKLINSSTYQKGQNKPIKPTHTRLNRRKTKQK